MLGSTVKNLDTSATWYPGFMHHNIYIYTRIHTRTHIYICSWFICHFSKPPRPAPGAHPASYTMGTGSFPAVKWPERESDQSFPWSGEDKNGRSYISFSVCRHALHRDNGNFNDVFASKDDPRWTSESWIQKGLIEAFLESDPGQGQRCCSSDGCLNTGLLEKEPRDTSSNHLGDVMQASVLSRHGGRGWRSKPVFSLDSR